MVKVFPFNTPSPGEGIIFCLFSFCFSGSVGGGGLFKGKLFAEALGANSKSKALNPTGVFPSHRLR